MDPVFRTAVIKIILLIIAGFGIIVGIVSLVFKLKGKDAKTVWIKYLAWFALIPPILIPLLYSRTIYQCVILVMSLWSFLEYSNSTGLNKDKLLTILCLASTVIIYYPIFINWYGLFQAIPIYVIAFILLIPILRGKYKNMVQKICLAVLGIIYFGWFLSHLAFLANYSEKGIRYILFLIILVESNDGLAYLCGSLIGKHKLIPAISPNKTIEGAAGALILVISFAFILRKLVPEISLFHIGLLGGMISIFGMCGDLVISFIKRDMGIKDMGKLIPGHGGILDRFDSLLFTAPLYFHFIRYYYL